MCSQAQPTRTESLRLPPVLITVIGRRAIEAPIADRLEFAESVTDVLLEVSDRGRVLWRGIS
jgi:hypothetical protein